MLAGLNTYYSNKSVYNNAKSYLYTNNYYWSFSPILMDSGGSAHAAFITKYGGISDNFVDTVFGVRPVVSLKSGTTATGSGTTTDPYVVK